MPSFNKARKVTSVAVATLFACAALYSGYEAGSYTAKEKAALAVADSARDRIAGLLRSENSTLQDLIRREASGKLTAAQRYDGIKAFSAQWGKQFEQLEEQRARASVQGFVLDRRARWYMAASLGSLVGGFCLGGLIWPRSKGPRPYEVRPLGDPSGKKI